MCDHTYVGLVVSSDLEVLGDRVFSMVLCDMLTYYIGKADCYIRNSNKCNVCTSLD